MSCALQTTSYAYCTNNPTNLIDPDGERIVVTDYFKVGINDPYLYEWTDEFGAWQFVENIIRVVHNSDIRVRYFDDDGYTRGKDYVVDRRTGRALYFNKY